MRSFTTFLVAAILSLSCAILVAETDTERQLFEFVNSERARENLEPLEWDKTLYKVALDHSKDMAKTHKVSHKGSDGSEPHERIREAKVYASKTAENIAGDINIISAHTSLMKSLYHRENILDPDFTHGAVAVYNLNGYLYVTEVFIRKIGDHSLPEARRLVLDQINRFRKERNLLPLTMSKSLSNVAQSHVDVQTNLGQMSPLLIMSVLTRQMKGSVLVNVYTSDSLITIPDEVRHNLELDNQYVGIGFKRSRGLICESGCYVVALIFGHADAPGSQGSN